MTPALSGSDGAVEFRLQHAPPAPELEPLWRALGAGGGVSFFTSWTWIGTWLEALPEKVRPLLLIASAKGGTIGAAIAIRRERQRLFGKARQLYFNSTGEPGIDGITVEHNGFVCDPEAAGKLWAALLDWFAEQKEFDELVSPAFARESLARSRSRLAFSMMSLSLPHSPVSCRLRVGAMRFWLDLAATCASSSGGICARWNARLRSSANAPRRSKQRSPGLAR